MSAKNSHVRLPALPSFSERTAKQQHTTKSLDGRVVDLAAGGIYKSFLGDSSLRAYLSAARSLFFMC